LPDALSTGPDGESLAIVTLDGVLHSCRADGSALRPPRQLPPIAGAPDPATLNPHEYHSLAYAPGGKHFTCSFRNTVRVFDAETLEVVMERGGIVQPQSAWLDERRLVFGNDRCTVQNPGTCAWIFDVQDRSTTELPQEWSAPLAVSADRSVVALTGGAKYEVSFLRATDLSGPAPLQNATPIGRWTHRSFGAPGWGNVLTLSADGRYFAALCGPFDNPAHYLEVAETATGRTLVRRHRFREAMTGLVLHPTEPLVAVVGTDAVVRMLHFLKPIPAGLATYDDDCDPFILDPLNGDGAHSPPRRLLTRSAQNGRAAFLLGHEGRGTGVVFARDGASLFTSAADGTVRCWSPSVPTPPVRITSVYLTQLERHPSVSPDASRLLYGIGDHSVRYWQEGRGYTHLAEDHLPLAVLPAGRLATMERKTSDIILWQEEGEAIRETDRIPGPGYIQGFDGLLRGLVFPGGTKIAGITPGRVFVVDLEKRTVSATSNQGWETGPSRAWDLAISPDGRHLAATGLGRRVRLYDPADLTKPAPPIGEFRTYDTALAFHPDGSRLYCGNEDGRVRVFDTTTWTEFPEEIWQAHRGVVTALAISNDTRLLATSGDTTLKLWLTEKAAGAARVEMLSFSTYFPAAWLHFGRDADGRDRSLLHAQPFCPLEIWPGSRSPVIATPPGLISPLKVLRAP
jgi:WD40 repeat protein